MSSEITLAAIKAEFPHLTAKIDAANAAGNNLRAIYRVASGGRNWGDGGSLASYSAKIYATDASPSTPTDGKVASEFSAADDAEVLRLARSLCTENRRARDCIATINVAQMQIGLELDTRARADERLSRELEQSKLGLAMKGSDVNSLQREISQTIDQRAVTYHASMVAGIDARIADLRAAQRQFFAELRRYVPIGLT